MSEKIKLPLSVLRPIQPVGKNSEQTVKEYQGVDPHQWEAITILWIEQWQVFAILDGHHRFIAAWLSNYLDIWCKIVDNDELLSAKSGIRRYLCEIPQRVEEYEMMYKAFMIRKTCNTI